MSKNFPKSAKAPKNESRVDGSTDSLLVLSDREKALLDVIQTNGFSLRNVLRVATSMSEELERGPKLDLKSLKAPTKSSKEKRSLVKAPDDLDLETKSESEVSKSPASVVPTRSQLVQGSGSTRRTRIKEARKELLRILVPEVDQVHLDDLRSVLERLAWLQSSNDWDVMSQNSSSLKDLSEAQKGLIREVLKEFDLKALLESKAKAVKASALEPEDA